MYNQQFKGSVSHPSVNKSGVDFLNDKLPHFFVLLLLLLLCSVLSAHLTGTRTNFPTHAQKHTRPLPTSLALSLA